MVRYLLLLCLVPAVAVAKPTYHEIIHTDTTVTGQPLDAVPDPTIRATYYEIPAGETFPVHKHPFHRSLYVIEGEIDITFPDLKQTFHYEKGAFIIEPREQWHYGKNNGTTPVKLLVIDVAPKGSGTNVILK